MKKSIRLFLLAPVVALIAIAACYAGFKVFERSIIEDHEALVHSVAQSILPALLAGDAQEVDRVLKMLASNPGIQTAELVSSSGVPLASYVRDAEALDPSQTQFALASVEESLGNHGLHVGTYTRQRKGLRVFEMHLPQHLPQQLKKIIPPFPPYTVDLQAIERHHF